MNELGIIAHTAPELKVNSWIDSDGIELNTPVRLRDYAQHFIVLYFFQAWCPGCHSSGFPTLKTLVDLFKKDDDVSFFSIQTVFEGRKENTRDKIIEIQST